MIFTVTPQSISDAGNCLSSGGLVAFPTETVYGLGADATSDAAVARIFAAKNRPGFNPLIVHVTDTDAVMELVDLTETAQFLAKHFWPGPLTLVLSRKANCPISLLVSAGLDTIAIRVPASETARQIIHSANVPVAAPSANASGKISPTDAFHVENSLGGSVDMILDGGRCAVGLESTVIDCSNDAPTLLRPGGVSQEEIEQIVGPINPLSASSKAPASPGMLGSHYAPDAAIRLNAMNLRKDEALLAFGPHDINGAKRERNLSPTASLREAAANLFSMLRELDSEADRIAVMPIPDTGLGRAINDRLTRAAAPRM